MATSTVFQAFEDPRAFVVPLSPMPGQAADTVLLTQSLDGPTYIRVGQLCTDEYLYQVWAERRRFPAITLDQLLAARDGKSSEVDV